MARDITQLHPKLQELIEKLQNKCLEKGLKIGISECYRSVSEQDVLYAQGRTVPGSIVTNAKGSTYSSMHQWYVAFDFYRNDGKGAYNDSDGFFSRVGEIGQSIGLEWGGSFSSIKDKPHFQLPDWGSTTSKLKKTYSSPDVFRKSWDKNGVETTIKTPATFNNIDWTKRLQKEIKTTIDGISGTKTLNATPTIKMGTKSNVAKLLQEKLTAIGYDTKGIDGEIGNNSVLAIKEYQRAVVGLKNPDGEFTAKGASWKKLLGL